MCPPAFGGTPSPIYNEPEELPQDVINYTVALLGTQGVGKTALISQFMTSECINAYDRQKGKFDSSRLWGYNNSKIGLLIKIEITVVNC